MRRLIFVLVTAAAVTIPVSPAAANPPGRGTFNFEAENVLSDVCPFDIRVVSVVSGRYTAFLDKNGVLTRVEQHILEQDTFSANGKSLAGIPFRFNFTMRFDATGNLTGAISTGVGAQVPLPDGSLFHSAGRIDFYALGMPGFWITPDHGSMVNVEGFCAALEP
jgi:hypothetical protein